jgi:hypothetical protein
MADSLHLADLQQGRVSIYHPVPQRRAEPEE